MKTLTEILAQLADEPKWSPEPVHGPITGKLWPGVASIPGASLNAEEAKGVCKRHNRTVAKVRALVEALKVAARECEYGNPDYYAEAVEDMIAAKLAELI